MRLFPKMGSDFIEVFIPYSCDQKSGTYKDNQRCQIGMRLILPHFTNRGRKIKV